MSSLKRRGSDLQSAHKRQDSFSSETGSESFAGSQESAVSQMTISDYTPEQKEKWRRFKGPDEFTADFDCDDFYKEHFKKRFLDASKAHGTEFQDYLVSLARDELKNLKRMLNSTDTIRWDNLNVESDANRSDASWNNLVFTWMTIKRLHWPVIESDYHSAYKDVLTRLFPPGPPPPGPPPIDAEAVESAFGVEQRPNANGQNPSDHVFKKIVQYYKLFNERRYLSPYTSLIGPSGIGKSFMVAQMAKTHGVYVVYTSLGTNKTHFPRPSVIADNISILPENRPALKFFWECYIWVGLLEVEVCRRVGITPSAFYELQTSLGYAVAYQTEFADRVKALFEKRDINNAETWTIKNEAIEKARKSVAKQSIKSLSQWKTHMDGRGTNSDKNAIPRAPGIPDALICIDEARALLRGEDSLLFRSLRTALQARFQRVNNKERAPELHDHQGDFFGIVLDTTSKVADFSPPARIDKSQKYADEDILEVFPPIFAVDTMDVFADPNPRYPDGSENSICSLFRYGRPLWGGMIECSKSGGNKREAVRLAWTKTHGQGASWALGLLSYRLNFYIFSSALAETLVADWMRYVLYVNPARDTLRTIQPSEPILADTAADRMKEPDVRYEVIKHFVTATWDGMINLGDLGEIIAALTLLFAFDETPTKDQIGKPAAVPLGAFLEALLGSEVASTLSDCVDTHNVMKELWQNGDVFCNHFSKVHRTPDNTTLSSAFYRGVGLFLPDYFPGADILIPVGNRDGVVSFLLIQVKNRKKDVLSKHLGMETDSSLRRAAEELNLEMPYIGFTMALRPHDKEGQTGFQIVQLKMRRRGRGESKYWWTNKTEFFFAITGFDEDTYPSTQSPVVGLLQKLLDCNAGVSIPPGVDERAYAARLRPLEWRAESKGKERAATEEGDSGDVMEE